MDTLTTEVSAASGFTIINPNTIDVKFHIIDNDIRTQLAEDSVIDWDFCYNSQHQTDEQKERLDRRCIFSLQMLLLFSNYNGIISAAKQNTNVIATPFYQALVEQINIISEIVGTKYTAGEFIPFGLLILALTTDQMVRIDGADGVSHAGKIVGCDYRNSYQHGRYLRATIRIVCVTNNGSYAYTNVESFIMAYEDSIPDDICISILNEKDKQIFYERGLKYVQLTKHPIQVQYSGAIVRHEYFCTRFIKASGRVMVDFGSMRIMDPNYQKYYGFNERIEGNSGELKVSLDMEQESNLVICSPYVYGFSFTATVWGQMVVDQITEVHYRDQAYDQLVLEPEMKRVILPLVKYTAELGADTDIIEGKGGGLVFLLDGNPGIGKTLTAEAIAEKLHRPLYAIGCGELGVNTSEVETRLKNILDMASAWNAVVLIDEADIFLEQRDSTNIERNAIVGIFLRLIEYYQGVLFLTTNRLQSLDRAFDSRISMSIHYPDLDEAGRLQVWNNLFTLVNSVDAEIDLASFAKVPLNGRNIKHVVRLATVLAVSENRPVHSNDIRLLMELQQRFSVKNKQDRMLME
jgi:hypothetical protein